MLKSTTALFLIYAILTVSLAIPVTAQQQVPAKEAVVPAAKNDPGGADMKDVFAKQTDIVKAEAAVFDPIKTERENAQQQAQKKGWSKTKKTLVIAAIAVGTAALLFLLVKYSRDCIRTDPEDCDPINDEFCRCVESVRRNP